MVYSKELKERWEKAAPNNAFVFAQLMQIEENCIGVLETFLNVKIDHIDYLETEETIDESYFSKGIRLDVYVQDAAGTVYNVEMQRRDRGNLPKRSRYYQSLIDVNNLEKSADYQKLRRSFVIFICNYDPFDRDHSVYYFENRDAACPDLVMGDEAIKLIFYTRAGDRDQIDPRLRMLLEFFDGKLPEKTSEDPLLQSLIDSFYRIKDNKKLEVGFMTRAIREKDLKDDAYADGYENAKSEFQSVLKEKDDMLAEKDDMLAEKEQIIAALKAALSKDVLEEVLAQVKEK